MLRQFIILEAEPVVRIDLDEMLSSAFPEAAVHAADTIVAGVAMIAETGSGSVIFVRSALAQSISELSSGLAQATERGALVYLLGDPISVSFNGRFIDLPFSQEGLVSQLLADLI